MSPDTIDHDEIEARFAEFGRRMAEDPDGVRREMDVELIARHGLEWFENHRRYLDNAWEYACRLLG
jgi:hypothetical protein